MTVRARKRKYNRRRNIASEAPPILDSCFFHRFLIDSESFRLTTLIWLSYCHDGPLTRRFQRSLTIRLLREGVHPMGQDIGLSFVTTPVWLWRGH